MIICCLDLEGVLVPEIWINVAERTGIEALRRTTRDEPDYDKLMRSRLEILEREGLGIGDIQAVIAQLEPLEGAAEFLDWLRERWQVVTTESDCSPGVRLVLLPPCYRGRLPLPVAGADSGPCYRRL